MYHRPHYT